MTKTEIELRNACKKLELLIKCGCVTTSTERAKKAWEFVQRTGKIYRWQ